MNSELERALAEGNTSFTAQQIRQRLADAGYSVIPREPKAHWRIPDLTGMTPQQIYDAFMNIAEVETRL